MVTEGSIVGRECRGLPGKRIFDRAACVWAGVFSSQTALPHPGLPCLIVQLIYRHVMMLLLLFSSAAFRGLCG